MWIIVKSITHNLLFNIKQLCITWEGVEALISATLFDILSRYNNVAAVLIYYWEEGIEQIKKAS